MALHKCGVAISKILLYGQKVAAILDFWQFFGHKMAKKQNFQNRYTKLVKCHTGKVHSKCQVLGMFSSNVPFVSFQYRDLKVLHVLYFQANRDHQKNHNSGQE